jgi:SAM-dependent methyltransferase
VILELGPGTNLAQGMRFVATGAVKYIGLDLFMDPDLDNPHSYAAAFNLLNLVSPGSVRTKAEDIFSVSAGKVVFNPARMEYLFPRQSYDIRLPDGSVDFVFSHSVFEHISDPDKTIAAIHKVLRKGGISAHHFDMRDHTDFSRPLEFLKADEASWRANFAGEKAFLYTNRRRLSDFVEAIERTGFKVLKVEPRERVAMSEEIRKGLHPDFQKYSLEDLAVVSALIVAEKS